jgi:hypothetical protein
MLHYRRQLSILPVILIILTDLCIVSVGACFLPALRL